MVDVKKLQKVEQVLKSVSTTRNLMVLLALRKGERYVEEIYEELKVNRALISTALKQLLIAGLVEKERRAQKVYYRIIPSLTVKKIFEIIDSITKEK